MKRSCVTRTMCSPGVKIAGLKSALPPSWPMQNCVVVEGKFDLVKCISELHVNPGKPVARMVVQDQLHSARGVRRRRHSAARGGHGRGRRWL